MIISSQATSGKVTHGSTYRPQLKTPIEYPLVATTMTEKQCQYIESPDLCSDLQASGLPTNTQIDIVPVPSYIIGLINGSLYVTQGCKQILSLTNLAKSDYITGQHLRDSIETHKLDIGCSWYILSNNFPHLTKCTNNSWITNTWKSLCEKNMVIEENTPNLKPKFLKDSHIMEDFIGG